MNWLHSLLLLLCASFIFFKITESAGEPALGGDRGESNSRRGLLGPFSTRFSPRWGALVALEMPKQRLRSFINVCGHSF